MVEEAAGPVFGEKEDLPPLPGSSRIERLCGTAIYMSGWRAI